MQLCKVVSFNVWNKSGPWPERLAMIRDELRALAPDLIGLQEVMRLARPEDAVAARNNDQAAEIADGLDFHVAYAGAQEYGNGLVMGNALLSRHPILESERYVLPGLETGETRSLLHALVETPWGRLPVFVTHFNWKFHQGNIRLRQAAFVAQMVGELAPIDDNLLPPIVMGDFNAEPEADEIRFLRGLHCFEGRSVYFADAWVYGGDGSAGVTYDPKNDFAARNREPPRRIDYVFVRGPDRQLRGEPMLTRVVFTSATHGPDGRIFPSDHYGVYSEICLEPRSL
ncbi:MAG TPA: endonuclease/exonuclease/phosphatase family protein [Polyangiaceae bacterium]|jgi:endonuclease/exonuclease/phosphatase family metal-dependent hydrolase|nr:endonuclease/exonuclease/phosphatase family protein [Polyangiaceae bacterium]